MSAFVELVRRDVGLAWREGGATGTVLAFYLIVVAVLPLGLGPDLKLLSRVAAGVLWVALLLSALLSVDRIFLNDKQDGTLEIMALGPLPLELVVAAKAFAHWLMTGIPLALLAPLLGLMLNLDGAGYGPLFATMIAGTPAVSFIGAIGAALTLGVNRGGLLLSLLILPLYVPVLIFGVSAVSASITGPAPFWPPFLILSAITLASLVLAPIAAAAALRLQL
ncbi:MAG: heme exporter protein CcmB [Hyphomicrobiaceae bacterium]